MNYESLEGLTLNSNSGVEYSIFKYAHLIEDEYSLPIYEGENRHNGKKVSIIAFEKHNATKQENRLAFFKKKKELATYDIAIKKGVNFVVFQMPNDDFEKFYFGVSHVENEQINMSQNIDKQVSTGKTEQTAKKKPPKRPAGRIVILVIFLFLAIGITSIYWENHATSIIEPTSTEATLTVAVITPSNTLEVSNTPLPTDTLIPQNTNTQAPSLTEKASNTPEIKSTGTPTFTNTLNITSTLTLTPSSTSTITLVPTRTGLPTELSLCVASDIGINIRSRPSIAADKIGTLGFRQCLLFNAKFEITKDKKVVEAWVHIAPNQEFDKNIIGGWVSYGYLTKGNLAVLEPITSNPEIGYVNTSTPTPTATSTTVPLPTITLTP